MSSTDRARDLVLRMLARGELSAVETLLVEILLQVLETKEQVKPMSEISDDVTALVAGVAQIKTSVSALTTAVAGLPAVIQQVGANAGLTTDQIAALHTAVADVVATAQQVDADVAQIPTSTPAAPAPVNPAPTPAPAPDAPPAAG